MNSPRKQQTYSFLTAAVFALAFFASAASGDLQPGFDETLVVPGPIIIDQAPDPDGDPLLTNIEDRAGLPPGPGPDGEAGMEGPVTPGHEPPLFQDVKDEVGLPPGPGPDGAAGLGASGESALERTSWIVVPPPMPGLE